MPHAFYAPPRRRPGPGALAGSARAGRGPSACAALCLLLLACGAEEQDAASSAPRVLTATVVVSDYEERIEASGQLTAQSRATIAAEVSGRITEIAVDEGDPVSEGQLLLSIDPGRHRLQAQNARARLAEAEAGFDEAERDFQRLSSLHERGIASDAGLDARRTELTRARSRRDGARAELGVAERALQDAGVRAPFAGFVARRMVSRGEFVQTGVPLFEIVSLDPVELEFSVAERDSARIELGQRVRVSVSPYPGEQFEGLVSVIAPTIDTRTRTLRVKARIENPDGRLRPGLFARADLGVAGRRDVIWAPASAVRMRAEGEEVFVMGAGDRVRRVRVETGRHRGELVEVRTGLAKGDEVVVRGHTGLSDGVLVLRRDADGGAVTGDAPSAASAAKPPEAQAPSASKKPPARPAQRRPDGEGAAL